MKKMKKLKQKKLIIIKKIKIIFHKMYKKKKEK